MYESEDAEKKLSQKFLNCYEQLWQKEHLSMVICFQFVIVVKSVF